MNFHQDYILALAILSNAGNRTERRKHQSSGQVKMSGRDGGQVLWCLEENDNGWCLHACVRLRVTFV